MESAREVVGADVVPPEIISALQDARQVALLGHVTPDADCLSSMGALQLGLRQLGKTCYPALPVASVSRKMEYIVELAELTPASLNELRACDLAVVVDTAKDRRVNLDGKLDALPGVPVMNVDHHATNPGYGSFNWVDGQRSSTAEMVFELLIALQIPITATLATLLYAGIHTDTQGFSLSNTTPRSLSVADALVRAGANVPEVGEKMHRSHSRNEFALLKVIYANTRVSDDGRLAWSSAAHDEIMQAGCNANDIDDQVEVPRSVDGIDIAILFSEGEREKIRMNFRGERGISVLELARQFGGGGHHASAGAIQDGALEAVMARVLPAAEAFLRTADRVGA